MKCSIVFVSRYTISWGTNWQGRYWRDRKALWICLDFWVRDKVIPYSAIGLGCQVSTVSQFERKIPFTSPKRKQFLCTCIMNLTLCGAKLTEVGINTCFFSAFNAYKYCRKSTEEFYRHSSGDWKTECARHKLTLTMCCLGCYWKVLCNNN